MAHCQNRRHYRFVVGANLKSRPKRVNPEHLKYSLEYHCYPFWNYTKDGELVDNDLPEELRKDIELDYLLH